MNNRQDVRTLMKEAAESQKIQYFKGILESFGKQMGREFSAAFHAVKQSLSPLKHILDDPNEQNVLRLRRKVR